jgi:ATP-dependent Clp protease protease subunit
MSSDNKQSNFDILIEHDLDIRARIIYVQGGIDEEVSAKFIKLLKYLDKTAGDIEIVLNSGGGCVTSGLAMHDAIKWCNNPVTVKAYGSVMSIASVILQAADTRIMSKYCRMMIHRGETEIVGDFNNVKKAMKEEEELDKIMGDIYFERISYANSTFKRSQLEKMMDTDTYLSSQQALELGLIDEIETEDDQ